MAEQNQDADTSFSRSSHSIRTSLGFVPAHYPKMYLKDDEPE